MQYQFRRYAACDLVFNCLPMSHKIDTRLIWVKYYFLVMYWHGRLQCNLLVLWFFLLVHNLEKHNICIQYILRDFRNTPLYIHCFPLILIQRCFLYYFLFPYKMDITCHSFDLLMLFILTERRRKRFSIIVV